MDTKVITCRTHGGTFRVPVKRGRPPVNCIPSNKCRKPKQTVGAVAPRSDARAKADSLAIREGGKPEPVAEAMGRARKADPIPRHRNVPGRSDSLPVPSQLKSAGVRKAFQAKAQLEALGWEVTGSKGSGKATVTATRGIELLVIAWEIMEGKLISQDYSLWDTTVGTGRNGKPDSKLPFDPDEVPDAELVTNLQGMKVTWWNSLAQANETAIISPDKITIEHNYTGHGDEVPGERMVKFADHESKRFRAFRLAALIKVG